MDGLKEAMKDWERIGTNTYRRGNYTIKTTGAEWVIIKDGYGRLSVTYKTMLAVFKRANLLIEWS